MNKVGYAIANPSYVCYPNLLTDFSLYLKEKYIMKSIKLLVSLLLLNASLASAAYEPLLDGAVYDTQYDRLTDSTNKWVIISSMNHEDVGYAYKKQYLILGLFNSSNGKYLIDGINILPTSENKYVFTLDPCFDYCEITFRFGDNKPKRYKFRSDTDNSYSLQSSQVQDFVKDIKTSKSVYTRVHSILSGSVDYEFDLSDIDFNKLRF
ncbi:MULTISPECIES: hypothetical protein [Psychrobacter]|uniref:hypothetical protein n=1 Tax=Psychrobacter TaxID=497 RepID=UPI00146EEB7F|nr:MULTISPECIES: hypothetical protein [Psychrobacter]